MRLHLAGISTLEKAQEYCSQITYALESFYYWKEWEAKFLPVWKFFLLDSGAFTFISSGKVDKKFDIYVERYIEFINQYGIQHFFEMDVDSVLGYERVRQIRRYIENRTNRPCIPVWHISRGVEDLKATCRDYKYVSIGQNVNRNGVKVRMAPALTRRVIDIAHENGAIIHGLGRTSIKDCRLGFDSIDSTSWSSGVRFSNFPIFRNGDIAYFADKSRRVKLSKEEVLKRGIIAGLKMQQYAEKYL